MRRLVVLLCAAALLLTGCWDRVEVEDLMFITEYSVDKGEHHRFLVNARVPVVGTLRSGVMGGREGGGRVSEYLAAEADSLAQAMYIMNAGVSRRLTMRHLRAIIVGEDLAREGVQDLVTELFRNSEVRATTGLMVARGSAAAVLRAARWPGETNPGKTTEGALLVERYLHMAPPIRLHQVFSRTGEIGVHPFGAAIGINPQVAGRGDAPHAESAAAGDLDRAAGNPVELAGTAVFRESQLVGYLTVDETQALLAMRGEMGKAYMTIPDPFSAGERILMRFQQENLPKFTASSGPGGPRVAGVILFEGEAISGDEDYRDPQVRRRVEESAAANMQRQIDSVLAKLKDWQADPVGFGLLFRGRFPTWQAWERYRWSDQVGRLRADIRASMRIRRYGLTMGPGPAERGD